MSDLLFTCPACSKSLAVTDKGVDKFINCPDCKRLVVVPQVSMFFKCPSCNCELSSSNGVEGKIRDCPNCHNQISIPLKTSTGCELSCPSCKVIIDIDSKDFSELAGKDINCPDCNAQISIPTQPTQPTPKQAISPPSPPALTVKACPSDQAVTGSFSKWLDKTLGITFSKDLHDQEKTRDANTTDSTIMPPISNSAESILQSSIPIGKKVATTTTGNIAESAVNGEVDSLANKSNPHPVSEPVQKCSQTSQSGTRSFSKWLSSKWGIGVMEALLIIALSIVILAVLAGGGYFIFDYLNTQSGRTDAAILAEKKRERERFDSANRPEEQINNKVRRQTVAASQPQPETLTPQQPEEAQPSNNQRPTIYWAQRRSWTGKNEKTVAAELVNVSPDGSYATLRTSDGQFKHGLVSKLSDSDQSYISAFIRFCQDNGVNQGNYGTEIQTEDVIQQMHKIDSDNREAQLQSYINENYPHFVGAYRTAREASTVAEQKSARLQGSIDAGREASMSGGGGSWEGPRVGRFKYVYDNNLNCFVVYQE